jgi:hypothetical protein
VEALTPGHVGDRHTRLRSPRRPGSCRHRRRGAPRTDQVRGRMREHVVGQRARARSRHRPAPPRHGSRRPTVRSATARAHAARARPASPRRSDW